MFDQQGRVVAVSNSTLSHDENSPTSDGMAAISASQIAISAMNQRLIDELLMRRSIVMTRSSRACNVSDILF